jgi:hypothetical protein
MGVGPDHEAIAYSSTKPGGPIARLQDKLDSGEVTLEFDDKWGYLPSLLEALKIPVSSQALVFSKTSLQISRIQPELPRAIYFNDDVYIGFVRNSPILEIGSVDPNLGGIFYTLDQNTDAPPQFQRDTHTCLMCHASSSVTQGVPGFMVLSVLPDRTGYSIPSAGTGSISDQTPFKERWGGWYVTGTYGDQVHWGNRFVPASADTIVDGKALIARADLSTGANVTSLEGRFDTSAYLSKHSDVVGLMVLTHQTRLHNLITRTNYEVKAALHDEGKYYAVYARPGSAQSEITERRIKSAIEPLLRAMLLVRETPLASPVSGTSGFAEDFQSLGPRDSRGRSLRDLDLNKRVFRYPLSFLIYSDAFNAMAAPAKTHFYKRLREVLTGQDQGFDFVHLSEADRTAILEILEDTKPDFVGAGL